MRFKVLKHKEEKGLFGTFFDRGEGPEIGHSNTPDLLVKEVTMEALIDYNVDNPLVQQQLEGFDLVEVSLLIIEK